MSEPYHDTSAKFLSQLIAGNITTYGTELVAGLQMITSVCAVQRKMDIDDHTDSLDHLQPISNMM